MLPKEKTPLENSSEINSAGHKARRKLQMANKEALREKASSDHQYMKKLRRNATHSKKESCFKLKNLTK